MSSSFSRHYTHALTSSTQVKLGEHESLSPTAQKLRKILITLSNSQSPQILQETANSIQELQGVDGLLLDSQTEEETLKDAIVHQLVIGLYAEALDTYLNEASQVEAEAEWWADIERSSSNVAWFLIQTLPHRSVDLLQTILLALRRRNLPIRPSLFTPSSLRRLFPTTGSLRPNVLLTALFPHLRQHGYNTISLSTTTNPLGNASGTELNTWLSRWRKALYTYITIPIQLTRQECATKRMELEKMRDQRAEVLGALSLMKTSLSMMVEPRSISAPNTPGVGESPFKSQQQTLLLDCVLRLDALASGQIEPISSSSLPVQANVMSTLQNLASTTLVKHASAHTTQLSTQSLLRPSQLTLIWPRLLLLPPLTLYVIKMLYSSRVELHQVLLDSGETVKAFFTGWLIEPLKEVLKTVRTGGEDGVIVRKEGITADLDSLERMSLSLAQDKLRYSSAQLAELSKQIRVGDLTPILRIYEDDIKNPIRSAATGTLLRSVFVQIQKAKVDIDQALAGIDKLLKSQELTFAFVGVAPAFAIVYLVGGALKDVWYAGSTKGRKRLGGKSKRLEVWGIMRKIERLLLLTPDNSARRKHHHRTNSVDSSTSATIPALTSGLLLLAITRLRTYAETSLPPRSRLRDGFLEDVGDLEDPDLGRADKLRVVERMWRCWGGTGALGWGELGDH